MNAPPFLCAAAVMFWGWQADHLTSAVLVALLLESPRIVATRLELSVTQVARAFDLGLGALIALAAALALRGNVQEAVLQAGGWLPAALLPFMIVHRFGAAEGFDIRALWWRAQRSGTPPMTPLLIDPAWIYAPLCLLAASIEAPRTPVFFVGAAAIGLWMLFPARSRRVPLAAWAMVALLTAGLGYAGQMGLTRLQKFIIDSTMDLLSGSDTDPYGKTTAIGEIGELKLSGAILVRVTPPVGQVPPRYLHRATYDRYAGGNWTVRSAPLEPVARSAPGADIALAPTGAGSPEVKIAAEAAGERTVLPVPMGTTRLRGLDALTVSRNRLGTLAAHTTAPLLRYEAAYDPATAAAGAVTAQDMAVPEAERGYLERWLVSRAIAGRPPVDVADALARGFERDFRYSLYQPTEAAGPLPIRTFLERTKAGHCEYFATATVLLLRAAGVPARYTTGYVVEERSRMENLYVVRARHAHAWARAFVDGAWHDLDTTPSTWLEAEREQASTLQPVFDLFALLRYRFRAWQAADGEIPLWPVAALIIALLALAARRLRLRRSRRRQAGESADPLRRPAAGLDSEFFQVERRLAAEGLGRKPGEPVADWSRRVARTLPREPAARLLDLAALHRRHRFDPLGLDPASRKRLATGAADWLARWRTEK